MPTFHEALAHFQVQLDADGRSHHTRAQYARHLELLVAWAASEGLSARVEDLAHEDIARFLASPAARTRADGEPKRATSGAGLRLGSALGLDVEDVDLAEGVVAIHTKGDRRERVFLPLELRAELAGLIGGRQAGPLFASQGGRRLSARHVQRRFTAVRERAGLPPTVTCHSLRHTFGLRLPTPRPHRRHRARPLRADAPLGHEHAGRGAAAHHRVPAAPRVRQVEREAPPSSPAPSRRSGPLVPCGPAGRSSAHGQGEGRTGRDRPGASQEADQGRWSQEEVPRPPADGFDLLRTRGGQELWQTYVQLIQAEAAFRIHKSDLGMRPIWHQKEERVKAHILVCFLAFALWKTLEGWQSRAGLGNSPRTILEELARIQSVDVVVPLVDGPQMRLRCVVRPDEAQSALLQRLGLRLPTRLRAPRVTAGM